MKEIVFGILVALFGASILQGNISHSSYDLMTVFAVVLVLGGAWSIYRGVVARKTP